MAPSALPAQCENKEGAAKLPHEGGEEDALEPAVVSSSFVESWIEGKASSFKGLHLEMVLLHDRNIFIDADTRHIYETEMACSSPPP